MKVKVLSAFVALLVLAGCGEDEQASSVVASQPSIDTWRWAPSEAVPPTVRPEAAAKPERKPEPVKTEPKPAPAATADAPATQDPDPAPAAPLAPIPATSKDDPSLVKAEVLKNGVALPPLEAPSAVRAIFEAGNTIARSPYKWGGGHGKWQDSGYDCSGSVSYALAAAGLIGGSATSGQLMSYGKPGKGKWITIYANDGHVWMTVAGVRFDTVARGQTGSRWINETTDTSGYVARHPPGL